MRELDPYRPPAAEITSPGQPGSDGARTILMYWERRRLLYNALLGIEGLTLVVGTGYVERVTLAVLLVQIALYGLTANVFYTVGPYLNLLATQLAQRSHKPWGWAFALGTGFSMLVTLLFGGLATL